MVESRLAEKGLGPDLRASGPGMAMSGSDSIPCRPDRLALTSQIRLSQTVFGWMGWSETSSCLMRGHI